MRRRVVVFDLDGTLVDSLPDIAGALNHVLVAAGHSALPPADVRNLVGEGVRRLVERALALQPVPAASDPGDLARALLARYRECPCVSSKPFPGMVRTLERLGADPGRQLVVVTNKPGDIARELLQTLGMGGHFAAVLGDGDGHAKKPDPAGTRALLAGFSAAPVEVLVVGDGLPDIVLARALGAPVAAVAWGYTPRQRLEAERPDHLIERPEDLLAIA